MNLKNTLCTMPPSLGEDFMQSLSSFLISLVVIGYWLDSRRKYNLKDVLMET